MAEDDFQFFIKLVKQKTNIDLSLYKEAQMKRRLTSLREKRGFHNFQAYFQAMAEEKELFDEFLDRMTINVSEFFRNANRWEVLEKKIIPRLLQRKKTLNIWSAACSTGEEPYSLVMLLTRFFDLKDIHVLATDLDTNAMQKAKDGIYIERSLQDVPSDLKSKYFQANGIQYKISEKIKERVTFKQQNLLADSFPSDMDLIVCRNVMIYFTEEAKMELYNKFAKALCKGGVLFVGSTEQIFQPNQFGLDSEDNFFYKKIL
jgi:chemotaxis protein methyltransferase CheR